MGFLSSDDRFAQVAACAVERALVGSVAAPDSGGGDAGGRRGAECPVDRLHIGRVLRVDADRAADGRGYARSDREVGDRVRRQVDRYARGEDEVPVERDQPLGERNLHVPTPELDVRELARRHHGSTLVEREAHHIEVMVPGPQPEGADRRAPQRAHDDGLDVEAVLNVEAARVVRADRDPVSADGGHGDLAAIRRTILEDHADQFDDVLTSHHRCREVEVEVDQLGRSRSGAHRRPEGDRELVRGAAHRTAERVTERRVGGRTSGDAVLVDVADLSGGAHAYTSEAQEPDGNGLSDGGREVECGREHPRRVPGY